MTNAKEKKDGLWQFHGLKISYPRATMEMCAILQSGLIYSYKFQAVTFIAKFIIYEYYHFIL